jgi:hypothetical protein
MTSCGNLAISKADFHRTLAKNSRRITRHLSSEETAEIRPISIDSLYLISLATLKTRHLMRQQVPVHHRTIILVRVEDLWPISDSLISGLKSPVRP